MPSMTRLYLLISVYRKNETASSVCEKEVDAFKLFMKLFVITFLLYENSALVYSFSNIYISLLSFS